MNIVYMNGGLGNQMFQYIFFRWLEINSREKCVVDNAPFYLDNVPHNGYELDRIFNLKPPMISDYFDKDVWQYIIDNRKSKMGGIVQQLANNGLPIVLVVEKGAINVEFDGPVIVVNEAKDVPFKFANNHIYYHGYWITTSPLNSIRRTIEREFIFPKIVDELNKKYADLIEKSINPVAIHIRRGDMAKLGWSCQPEHFRKGIFFSENNWRPDKYFLFSDDLDWCNKMSNELGLDTINHKLIIVNGNNGENAYRDMQLMTMCHHRISDHSSFSLMAAMLCQYPNKEEFFNWKTQV